MSRTRTALVGVVAAGLMLMSAQAASADEPTVERSTLQLDQGWSITSLSTSTSVQKSENLGTDYRAQIQQPINPDKTSAWPAKRGVIPVQFKLTENTRTKTFTEVTTTPSFKSICSNSDTRDDNSFLTYTPVTDPSFQVSELHNLQANYSWLNAGHHAWGSLRWSIAVQLSDGSTKNINVYFGDAPNFTTETPGINGSGANLLADAPVNDLRFDTSQLPGGTFYDSWANVSNPTKFGGMLIKRISLVVDGCGSGVDQDLALDSVWVNGSGVHIGPRTWESDSSVTLNSVPTNSVPATIRVEKVANDGTVIDWAEQLSSAQGDTDGVFRQIDGKYIYNMKVEGLSGKGNYQVFMVVNGTKVVDEPGVFELK